MRKGLMLPATFVGYWSSSILKATGILGMNCYKENVICVTIFTYLTIRVNSWYDENYKILI